MDVVAVIPARLASTRLPRKILADIHGHPMLWHVWQRVRQATKIQAVYIATDSEEVASHARSWGATAIMTPTECVSGTDRIAAALPQIGGRFVLNVQGDEPLLDPSILDALVTAWNQSPDAVVTPVFPLNSMQDVGNPSIVKVVKNRVGRALYFSRSVIPHIRGVEFAQWHTKARFWGHLGLYGYPVELLKAFPSMPRGPLELCENLEQMRFLENGLSVMTVEVDVEPGAVDTSEDLEHVRRRMAAQASGIRVAG